MGVNSFRPHAAANVLQNQFGDCKDKANLFNTLLRTMNIPADLVLVPRFGQVHQDIPGLAFNHAISRVRVGDEVIFVDTTDDVCRFGMLPPGDPGRNVLAIEAGKSDLTRLPDPDPEQHVLTLRGKLQIAKADEPVPTTLEVQARGYPDYDLRATARQMRAHANTVPLLEADYRPVAGVFTLDEQDSSGISALDANFSWHGTGSWVGMTSGAGEAWQVRAPFWFPKEWDLALHKRSQPLFLHQGFPLCLDERLEISLPADASRIDLPAAIEQPNGVLRWRVAWERLEAGRVAAIFSARLEKGDLDQRQTAEVRKELQKLRGVLSGTVNVHIPAGKRQAREGQGQGGVLPPVADH
jgi:hypothetical protein